MIDLETTLPAVLTPEDVASYLRIGRTACYELLRRRDGSGIPHVRVGKLYRIHRDALLAWLQAGNGNEHGEAVR